METIDRTIDDIMERLEKLRKFVTDFRTRLREWAKDQPQIKRCERHQHDRPIDWEQSCRASVSERDFQLVYAPCPSCKSEEKLLTESGWLHDRGVPLILCHARFENFTPRDPSDKRALEAAGKFSRRASGFLLLTGPVGSGKSHLGVAIMREKRCGLFVPHSTLLEGIRKMYRDKTAPDPVEACKRARFLVLDDLGISGGGADDQPALHSILSHRYGEKLPTMITSNLSKSEFLSEIGDRMFDRIREGLFKWIELTGESKRGQLPYVD